MTERTVQIAVRARNLTNANEKYNSSFDTFAVVTLLPADNVTNPIILGKTEMIRNSSDPNWTTHFYVDYQGEKKKATTYILIKVFENQMKSSEYREVLSGIFDLDSILSSECNTMSKKGKDGGEIHVDATMIESMGDFHLKLSGKNLINARGPTKKTTPFYQFTSMEYGLRRMEMKDIVHRSDKCHVHSLNPKWQYETISLKTLCRGNKNFPVLLSIYHHKSNGKHILIGEVVTSVNDLILAFKEETGIKVYKNGKQTGFINVDIASVVET